MSLLKLRQANILRAKEWDPHDLLDLTFFGNELAGETGEACNIIKKMERERLGLRGSRATLSDLESELADVVIVTDLIAMRAGLSLESAVHFKFNETSRKYQLSIFME